MLLIAKLIFALGFEVVELCDFLFRHITILVILYLLFSKRAVKC